MWAILPRRCWISGRSNPLPSMGHSSFSPHDKELKLPSEGWLLFSYCPTPRGFFFQKPFAAKVHLSSRLQLLAWSRSLVQKEEPSPGVSQIDTTSDWHKYYRSGYFCKLRYPGASFLHSWSLYSSPLFLYSPEIQQGSKSQGMQRGEYKSQKVWSARGRGWMEEALHPWRSVVVAEMEGDGSHSSLVPPSCRRSTSSHTHSTTRCSISLGHPSSLRK